MRCHGEVFARSGSGLTFAHGPALRNRARDPSRTSSPRSPTAADRDAGAWFSSPRHPGSRHGAYDGTVAFGGGWGRGKRPVINVSWDDTRQYVSWMNVKIGKRCTGC